MTVVEVHWIDSAGTDGWVDRKDASAEADAYTTITTIGYLLDETTRSITISSSVGKGSVHAPLTIPKRAIDHMWEWCVT